MPTTTAPTIRASFDLRLAGEPAEMEDTAERLTERLAARGFFIDEDLDVLVGDGFVLRLRTRAALLAALELLPALGIYMVETNRS